MLARLTQPGAFVGMQRGNAMSHRLPLSAFPPPGTGSGAHGRGWFLLALLALLIAAAAGWVLPARSLLPLENALRVDSPSGLPAEPGP